MSVQTQAKVLKEEGLPHVRGDQVGGPPLDEFIGSGAGHNDTENQEIEPAPPPEWSNPKQDLLDDEDREEPEGQVAYPVIVVPGEVEASFAQLPRGVSA